MKTIMILAAVIATGALLTTGCATSKSGSCCKPATTACTGACCKDAAACAKCCTDAAGCAKCCHKS